MTFVVGGRGGSIGVLSSLTSYDMDADALLAAALQLLRDEGGGDAAAGDEKADWTAGSAWVWVMTMLLLAVLGGVGASQAAHYLLAAVLRDMRSSSTTCVTSVHSWSTRRRIC
jgi:hypothetical protein